MCEDHEHIGKLQLPAKELPSKLPDNGWSCKERSCNLAKEQTVFSHFWRLQHLAVSTNTGGKPSTAVNLYDNNNYKGLVQVSIKGTVISVLTDTQKSLRARKITLSSLCMNLTTVVLGPTYAPYAARTTISNSSN